MRQRPASARSVTARSMMPSKGAVHQRDGGEIVGGEQPQGDDLDADLLAPGEQIGDVVGAGLVALEPSTRPFLGPPPVAVEHDADVPRDAGGLELAGDAAGVRGIPRRHPLTYAHTLSTPVDFRPGPRYPGRVPSMADHMADPHDPHRTCTYLRNRRYRGHHARRAGDRVLRDRHPDALEERVDAVIAAVKPHLRGWLHLAMAPLALLAGLVLIVVSDHLAARISAAVFTITAVLLFGVSRSATAAPGARR